MITTRQCSYCSTVSPLDGPLDRHLAKRQWYRDKQAHNESLQFKVFLVTWVGLAAWMLFGVADGLGDDLVALLIAIGFVSGLGAGIFAYFLFTAAIDTTDDPLGHRTNFLKPCACTGCNPQKWEALCQQQIAWEEQWLHDHFRRSHAA